MSGKLLLISVMITMIYLLPNTSQWSGVEWLTEWSWETNGPCWNWTSTTKDLMTWACHSLSWYLDDFINKTEQVIIAMLWHCYVKWGQWGVSENLICSLSPVAIVYRDYLLFVAIFTETRTLPDQGMNSTNKWLIGEWMNQWMSEQKIYEKKNTCEMNY